MTSVYKSTGTPVIYYHVKYIIMPIFVKYGIFTKYIIWRRKERVLTFVYK